MFDLTISITLDRPPIDVFTYITDLALLPTWQTHTISTVTDDGGPVRLGTRLHQRCRTAGGAATESVLEVAEYVPAHLFGVQAVTGSPIHRRIELEAQAGGTLLHLTVHGSAGRGRGLRKRALRRSVQLECANLQRILAR